MVINYKDRCQDCGCLVEGENGKWVCDAVGRECITIKSCGEWVENGKWAEIN